MQNKKKTLIIISFIVVVLCGLMYTISSFVGYQATKQEIVKLTKQDDELNAQLDEIIEKADKLAGKVYKEETGKDSSRVSADEAYLKSLFEPAFIWQSGLDYNKARNAIIKEAGKNDFVTGFLKPIDIANSDMNEVDLDGIKMDYKSFDIYPAVYGKSDYCYYIVVDCFNYRNNDNNYKDNLNSREIVIFVEMSGKQKISSVKYWRAVSENESEDMMYLNNFGN